MTLRTAARLILPGSIAAILAGSPLIGCRQQTHPACHLYVGLDTSGSARANLGSYVVLTKSMAEQLQIQRDQLTLYRMDANTHEFSDGVYDGNVEAMLQTVVAEVKTPNPHNGTYSAVFWHRVADRAATEREPVAIYLMSDGDNDDSRSTSWQAMRQAAQRLANNRQVRAVVLCGVRQDNWERLRQTFAPLSGRLHLLSPTQLQTEKALPFLEAAQN